jgi:hypothetical protein
MLAAARTHNPQGTTVIRSATLAMAGITYFVLVIVVLHFLRPDYHPLRQPTSDYAVGPYGFLMTTAFFSMSVATVALIVALRQGVPPAARSRAGLVFLGLWAVGVLVAMTFPTDLDGAPQTVSGTIHQINGPLAFLSLAAGAILVSRRFKHDADWRPVYRPTLGLALLLLVEFAATGAALSTGAGLGGLFQRLLLVTLLAWFFMTATRLRALAYSQASVNVQ